MVINIKMKKLLYTILIILFSVNIYAQSVKEYVIVTIERQSNSSVHQSETDYWITDIESWKSSKEEVLYPLYLSGFTATDYDECCINKNLILFNVTSKESFDYKEGLLDSLKKLEKIISNNRKKVQTVKKKWKTGKKENICIYLTPISGNFCFCKLSHKDDNSKIGYDGSASIPVSDFNYDNNFWESKISKGIMEFDYTSLPFLSLHTLQ